ncbi:MAG: HypC/HybG/HupF family hydrogenase formation chaperone, partial [Plesiomonas shigelloides]
MCLGIPGQIVAIRDEASVTAVVDVCGVKREVNA